MTIILFFLVFVFWEEVGFVLGGVGAAYNAIYLANGLRQLDGLVLATIVVVSGVDTGWAPLVFAIEIGMVMDEGSEVNVY